MKTNSLLFFAAFGLLSTTGAIAAQPQVEAEVIVLPTYVVRVPRYQPFEKQMKTNLREVSQQAHASMAVILELPLVKSPAHAPGFAMNLPVTKAGRNTKS